MTPLRTHAGGATASNVALSTVYTLNCILLKRQLSEMTDSPAERCAVSWDRLTRLS